MKPERTCCDGKCNQGRNCPLTQPALRDIADTESEIFEAVALVVAGVLTVICAIGLIAALAGLA
jgi:hypothetical protein